MAINEETRDEVEGPKRRGGGRLVTTPEHEVRAPLAVSRPSTSNVTLAVLTTLALLTLGATAAPPPFRQATLEQARALRERALRDDTAYELVRSLTTEVGPRFAGTEGDARAVAWAITRLRALGFENVRAESVHVPRWVRGEARAEILEPWPQPLVTVALGGSPPTPPDGISAEVVAFSNIEEMKAAPPAAIAGRIVFFHGRMQPTRDTQGYATAVRVRSRGALEASRLGAVAVVIRSIGTSKNRVAHTGGHRPDSSRAIPALAISNPDADVLERQVASGQRVRLRLFTSSRHAGEARSANVIGEIPGSARGEIVLLGAHLDSWELGTGAHDDAAGVGIVTAAARLIGDLPGRPRRTLRVVLFANEEFGLSGAKAYLRAHAGELDRHVIALEADHGAFAPWGLESRVPHEHLARVRAMHAELEPLGLAFLGNVSEGAPDIGALRERGVPVLEVFHESEPYFEIHHTPNDTFDKVDPEELRRCVAAYTVLAFLAAESEQGFGRLPVTDPAAAAR